MYSTVHTAYCVVHNMLLCKYLITYSYIHVRIPHAICTCICVYTCAYVHVDVCVKINCIHWRLLETFHKRWVSSFNHRRSLSFSLKKFRATHHFSRISRRSCTRDAWYGIRVRDVRMSGTRNVQACSPMEGLGLLQLVTGQREGV